MGTVLHELGHAVYDKYILPKLPWQLRSHAHIFTTEAIAMLFGRLASNPYWIKDLIGMDETELASISNESYKSLRLEQLTFSRWSQLMYQFEKQMYKNPDQDLNSLWWQLAEKYQLLKKPEGRDKPDWAAKIHMALYPAYYHNYQLGELLASQLNHYICKKVLKVNDIHHQSFYNQPDVGEYLKHLFFSPGALYKWDELIVKSTGEPLTAKYYAEQFVGEEELLK
jgi:peptidyl-dipeptidase A